MTKQTLVIILIVWIGSNLVLPLLIRSLDRLYKDTIDKFISKVFTVGYILFNRFTQLILMVYFLPAFVLVRLLTCLNLDSINRMLKRIGLIQLFEYLYNRNFTTTHFFRYWFQLLKVDAPNKANSADAKSRAAD